MNPEQIEALSDAWIGTTVAMDGTISIGSESERHRLRANGIEMHALDLPSLRAAGRGLMKILLIPPGMNTVIDFDHFNYWAWVTEVVAGGESSRFTEGERELQDLWSLCCRAALSTLELDYSSTPINARELALGGSRALAYLGFPLVEGVARKSCPEFIGLDGIVVADFSDGPRRYVAGTRCTSIATVLRLAATSLPEAAKSDLAMVETHLRSFRSDDEVADGVDGWAVLARWRNSSLHGETSFNTIGGTLLCLASLLALSWYEGDYDLIREQIEKRCRWNHGRPPPRPPWSFYPPA